MPTVCVASVVVVRFRPLTTGTTPAVNAVLLMGVKTVSTLLSANFRVPAVAS